jgi:[CysO sulfur-carrier protein]-S-L-cysteine hydrolase
MRTTASRRRSAGLTEPLRISRELLEDVIAHARDEAPNECCGMIASRDGVAVSVHRARNAAASPLRYIIDPREQFEITQAIEDAGNELGVIYHSHTRSDPVPSQTDINLAKLAGTELPAFPGTLYLIVGLKAPEADLRTWTIVGNDVTQVDLQVEE